MNTLQREEISQTLQCAIEALDHLIQRSPSPVLREYASETRRRLNLVVLDLIPTEEARP